MLGGVEVTGADGPLALGPTARVLLAALLVARHEAVGLDSLAEALWRDHPPATARATLQTHLSKLRGVVQAVPGASLELRSPGYVLDADRATIDADRFEDLVAAGRALAGTDAEGAAAHLELALACWHGDALAGFASEPWALPEAARLTELRLVTEEERVDLLLDTGRHADLVPGLEALVGANPLRERLRGQLMVALYRSGRQAEALRSAQELRRHLGEQLGLEPSAALRRLEAAIAVDDPDLHPTGPAAPAAAQGPGLGAGAHGSHRRDPPRRPGPRRRPSARRARVDPAADPGRPGRGGEDPPGVRAGGHRRRRPRRSGRRGGAGGGHPRRRRHHRRRRHARGRAPPRAITRGVDRRAVGPAARPRRGRQLRARARSRRPSDRRGPALVPRGQGAGHQPGGAGHARRGRLERRAAGPSRRPGRRTRRRCARAPPSRCS